MGVCVCGCIYLCICDCVCKISIIDKLLEKGNFLNGNFGRACEKALETQFVCQQDKTQSGVSSGSFYYQSSLQLH